MAILLKKLGQVINAGQSGVAGPSVTTKRNMIFDQRAMSHQPKRPANHTRKRAVNAQVRKTSVPTHLLTPFLELNPIARRLIILMESLVAEHPVGSHIANQVETVLCDGQSKF